MSKKDYGTIKNWDGIPVYDLNAGIYLLKFDREQKAVMDEHMWRGSERSEEITESLSKSGHSSFRDISLFAYPGLSPAKMRLLEGYSEDTFTENNPVNLKTADPSTWAILWKLTHSSLDDWQFFACLITYFHKGWNNPSGIDLFSVLGEDVLKTDAITLTVLGEAYINGTLDPKKGMPDVVGAEWTDLTYKVRHDSLKEANKEFTSLDGWISYKKLTPPPHNIYNSASRYGNFMRYCNFMNHFYQGSNEHTLDMFVKKNNIWELRLGSTVLQDKEFDSKGNKK